MTQTFPLNQAWNFRRLPPAGGPAEAWTQADLPHSPFTADLDGREHWFGECEYVRTIELPPGAPAGRRTLYVGAAMHTATVLLDGAVCGRHTGGYLPFEVDLTAGLQDNRPHVLTLRLDNRDHPDIPPGKPYADLDFCWYGGLYRNAELRCSPKLHLTDAVGAGVVGGGGIFVRTLAASETEARISVSVQIANAGREPATFVCSVGLWQGDQQVALQARPDLTLAPGTTLQLEMDLTVARPALWTLEAPSLHSARVELHTPEGKLCDRQTERFGIRRIGFSRSAGFTLNGRRLRLRGTNRHQDHPRVGYALPAAAQRRDALRIKEAGFDYVRLSHYPQSPDFLKACDELGLLVMNCIPGWQYLGGPVFQDACVQNARDLIRRDRNHPCVILWELSLNETEMSEEFMARLHAAGHEEYPGDQMFTCGWQDRFDVYIHSRQHGEIHRWANDDKAMVIAEYGDWEFYASNHGLDQKTRAGVYAHWTHSRQGRRDGERGLRRQAENHMIALNDTLSSPAVLDGLWSMFDYPRGYAAFRAASGVMDLFRLPKFSYHFYRSQRDATATGTGWRHGPHVFIASHWTPASDLRVLVFSNGDEVELTLNGRPLGRQKPAHSWKTQYLPHPPFVFDLPAFSPGVLEATAFIVGIPVTTHRVSTPRAPARLALEIETLGVAAAGGEPDVLFAHASLLDDRGAVCLGEVAPVRFSVAGGAQIVGPDTLAAEAGIASVVLRLAPDGAAFRLHASRTGPEGNFQTEMDWQHPAPTTPAVPAEAPRAADPIPARA